MSTIINADTSDGLKFTSDTSGEIKLQSAGADKVTITSAGNVGIGTTSPTNNLQIYNNGATSGQIHITNASTGATLSDGVLFGYDGSNDVIINNQEATATKFYTNGSERMRLDSGGKMFIGCTTAPSTTVVGLQLSPSITTVNPHISSSGSQTVGTTHFEFKNGNGTVGNITTSGTSTSYATSSDYRLKNNVAPMSGSINRLKQLKPSTWTWVHGGNGEGFLAHEAQAVVPEAVTGTKDAVDDDGNPVYQGIDQSKLVPLLTAALQEAITKIEDLETRIQALENA